MRNTIKILSAATLGLFATSSFAAYTYSTGFESTDVPGFGAAAVGGQNGWAELNNNDGGNTGFTNVVFSPANAYGGNQALRFSSTGPTNNALASGNSFSYAASPVSTNITNIYGGSNDEWYVTAQVQLKVTDPAPPLLNQAQNASDFYGIRVWDNGSTPIAGVVRALDGTGTPKLYKTGANGLLDNTPIGNAAASDVYGELSLRLDYVNGVYEVISDGTSLGSFPLRTGYTGVADVLLETSGRGTDLANFDNFSVSAIPEPATGAMLMLGGLALLARRRRTV